MKFKYTFLSFLSLSSLKTQAQEQPNIVLILADDLGYADMSFLPQSSRDVHTPNIDRLAKDGVYFTQAYATCPISSPARAGLLTGRHQQRWGNYWFGQGGLPKSEYTIAEYLKEAGYYTVKVGKTHKNGKELDHPKLHGYDDFFGFLGHTHSYTELSHADVERLGTKAASQAHVGPLMHNDSLVEFTDPEDYSTKIFTDYAVNSMKEAKKAKKPLFMYVSYNAVHVPTYQHTPLTNEKYQLSDHESWDPKKESYTKWHHRVDWKNQSDPDRRRRYLTCLEIMDQGIGKILDEAKKDKNTIVIFLSDNGGTHNTEAYNTPLTGHKYRFNEGGIRVPLIISCPKRWDARVESDQMVSAMDILPTLLEIVRVDAKKKNLPDGKSLLRILNQEEVNKHHESLVFDGEWAYAVRSGDWKFIRINEDRISKNYEEDAGDYLYNLSHDIREANNLAKKKPEIVEKMKAIYESWKKDKPKSCKPAEANKLY